MSGLGLPSLIRTYRRSDLLGAAGVMYRSRKEAYSNRNWNDDPDRILKGFTQRQDEWLEIWVSVCCPQVNGVLCLEDGHVDQLFVDPVWQGKGVGRSLLERASMSFPSGYTLDVFASNRSALQFYGHLGLKEIEKLSGVDGRESIIRLRWLP